MSLPMQEQWRPVLDWESYYEVSDLGNVRSRDRVFEDRLGRLRRFSGQPIAVHVNSQTGRRMVTLKGGGRRLGRTVYTLVLEAFVGPRPEGAEACHGDGDRLNDRLDNLRWDSRSGNMLDAVRHGTHRHAAKTRCVWGHRLIEPNLGPRRPGRVRVCLACSRARGIASYEKQMDRPAPDHKTLSDHYYRRIMKGALDHAA